MDKISGGSSVSVAPTGNGIKGRGRFLGTAQDARSIAEALINKTDVKRPKRASETVPELARKYADTVVLEALFAMEQQLRRPDLEAKDAVAILKAARDHSEWAFEKKYGHKAKAKSTTMKGAEDDLSQLDTMMENERSA